jgi:hypothetical protein
MHKVVLTLLIFTALTVFGQQQGETCEGKIEKDFFLLFSYFLSFVRCQNNISKIKFSHQKKRRNLYYSW